MSLGDRAKRVVWAPSAKRDLREIWRYFARIASIEVADNLVHEINRATARLADFPLMGRARDELIAGLRSILVHPHVVFYRVSDRSVEIARVLHQRRDLATALRTREDAAR
jgi:toxin ParE1/3/4